MRNSRRSTRTSTINSSSDRSSPLAIPPQSFPYSPSNIIERDGIANKVSKEDERGRKKQIYPLLNNNDDRKKHTSPTPGQHSVADGARKGRALAHVLPQSNEVSKQIHEKTKSGIKIIENGSSLPMDSVVFVDNFKMRSTKHQAGKETSSDGYFAAPSKANSSAPSVKLSNKVKKGPKNIAKQKKEFFSGPTPNSSMISASLGLNIDKQQHIQASKKTISGAAITFKNGTNSRSLSKNLTPDSTAVFAAENKKSGHSRISTQRRNSGCSSNEGHNSLSAISTREILLEKSEKASLIVPSKCNAKTNSSCVRGIVSNNVVVKKKGFSNSTLKPLSSPHSPNMKFSDDKNPHRFGQKKSLGISSTTKRKHFDATMGCKPVISTHPLNARNSGVNETKNKYSNTPTLATPSNKKHKITSGTLDYQQTVKKEGLNEGKSSSTNINATKQTKQNSVLDRNSIKRRVSLSLKEESLSSASVTPKKIESRLSSSLSHEQITETGKEDYMHVMHLSNFEGGFGNCTNDTVFSEQNIVNADKELPDHMYNGLHHHAHDESRVNHKTLTTVSAVVNGPVSRSSMGQTAKNGVHGNATERSKKCESSKIFCDSINVVSQIQKAGNASIKSKYHFSERQTYQSHLPLKGNFSQMMTNIETTSSHAEDCLFITETHQHDHAITGAPHFDGLSNSRESSKNSTFKLMSPSLMCAEDEDIAQPHHLNRKRTNSGGIIRQRNEYKVMKKAAYSHDTKCESGRAKAKFLSVNKLKMKLFVESCKCHQGLGAERLFAEYWERLGFYLSSMKSTPGNRSSLNFEIGYSNDESKNEPGIESKKGTCGIETFLDYFLNSKQLKRLHNLVISALMKQSLSPRLIKSKYVPHIPVKWKRNVRTVPLIADKKCHVNLESSLNAAHDLAAHQHDAGLSYNLKRWEETKQDLLEQKESFGIFSGIWNANKDNGMPHPNVITLRNISQGSSNNPILRMKSSDEAVQAALPGSLAVDNIVRKLSRAKGMNVSDSAMWLLTIAVRRQALKVLTNTIKDIIDVGEGVISSTAFLERSSKLGSSNFQANELCASKKLSSKGSSMDLLQEESIIINFNKSRKRSSITPLDLAQTIASNPSLFGASFGSSSSRLFYEQCMLSESGKNMQQYDKNASMVTDSDIGQVNALYVNEASPLDHDFRAPHHRQNNQTTANDQDQRCHQEHYQESSRKPEINLPISGKLTSETSSRAVTTAAVTAKKPAATSSTTTPTIIMSEKKDAHQKEQKKRQFQQTKQQQKKQSRSTKQQREVPQYNKQQNDKPQHKIAKSQSNQQNIKSQSINQQSIQSQQISQHNTKSQPTNQQKSKSQLNSQHSTKPQPVRQQNKKSQLTSQQSIKPQPVNQRNTRSKPMNQQSAMSEPVNQENGKPQSIKDHNGNAPKIKENNGKPQQIKQMREQNKKPLRGCGRGKDLRALIAVRTTDNNLEAVNQPSSVKGESKTTSGLPAKPKKHPTVTRQVSTGSGRGRGKDFSAMRRRRSVPDRVGASTDCVTNSATKIDTSSIDSHGQFQNATHLPLVKGDPAAVNCNLKTNTSASSGRGTGDKQLAKLRRAEENRKKEVQ